MLGQEGDVCAINKAGFHEDGGHGGMAQDAEGGMGFNASVFIACVKGGETFDKLVLDAAGKPAARAAGVVAEGFRASPAAPGP